MPGRGGNRRFERRHLVLILPVIAVMVSALFLLYPGAAWSQSAFDYLSYQVDIYIEADTSLMVTESVTYLFREPQEAVGLFIPSQYGTVGMGMILDGEGSPLDQGQWDYQRSEDGFTLRCYTGGYTGDVTYTYLYYIYDSLEVSDGLIGLEWAAVPEERGSPIMESSVNLHFPRPVDPSGVEISAQPTQYSGEIDTGLSDNLTAYFKASDLGAESSYSFSCYWPSSMMDLDNAASAPSWVEDDTSSGKSWDFERFDADITVNGDSSITVRETQVVNFRGSFSFLNRDLSTSKAFFEEGRTYGRVRVHDIQVYDLDGQPYPSDRWSVDSYEGGKTVHLEFEAENEQLGWIISYRMTGALIFSRDYDRLYWNAVSDDRAVPINSSEITVHLPAGADMDMVRTETYPDPYVPPSSYHHGLDGDVLWWSATDIAPYTTFTIDVAFPKGLVTIPWQYTATCGIAVIAFSLFFFPATLLCMLALWWKRGRDYGRGGSTMVRYDPPEDLRPAMVGMLMEESPRTEDISATIVDLACRGKLIISEEEREGPFKRKRYGFKRLEEDQSDLLPYERKVLDGLFDQGDQVTEDDLVNKFYTHMQGILDGGIAKEVMKRHLFVKDPRMVRSGYYWKGILLAALPSALILFMNIWLDMGWLNLLVAAFIPAGLSVAVVGRFMPSRTPEGSLAYEHALGFRDFLVTAEKPELDYMTPENFQKSLPYAMVMGVSEQWASKFRDIYTAPPEWYSGSYTRFDTMHLASSLNNMTANLGRTLTSSPSSSGGSGGGGFGGGSSGGGFGGGGSSAG